MASGTQPASADGCGCRSPSCLPRGASGVRVHPVRCACRIRRRRVGLPKQRWLAVRPTWCRWDTISCRRYEGGSLDASLPGHCSARPRRRGRQIEPYGIQVHRVLAQYEVAGTAGRGEGRLQNTEHDGRSGNAGEPSGGLNPKPGRATRNSDSSHAPTQQQAAKPFVATSPSLSPRVSRGPTALDADQSSGGLALRANSSAISGNQMPAGGSSMPRTGSSLVFDAHRVHCPSDWPGVFAQT